MKNYIRKTKEEQYDPNKKMPQRGEDPLKVITELLKEEKKISCFAFINRDWEGDTLPGGTLNESGTILAKDGKIYDYWLDWDPEKIAPDGSKGYYTLGENFVSERTGKPYPLFREVSPEEYQKYQDDPSFIAAKKRLGLK